MTIDANDPETRYPRKNKWVANKYLSMQNEVQFEDRDHEEPLAILTGSSMKEEELCIMQFIVAGWEAKKALSALTLTALKDFTFKIGIPLDKITLPNADGKIFLPFLHCVWALSDIEQPGNRTERRAILLAKLWLLGEGTVTPEFLMEVIFSLWDLVMEMALQNLNELINFVYDPSREPSHRLDRLERMIVDRISSYASDEELFEASKFPQKLLVSVISHTRSMAWGAPWHPIPWLEGAAEVCETVNPDYKSDNITLHFEDSDVSKTPNAIGSTSIQ